MIPALALSLISHSSHALGAGLARTVHHYIEARKLCATIDFYDLEVSSRDGVTANEDDASRMRTGDRLIVRDVDIEDNGYALDLEVSGNSTRGKEVDVTLVLYESIRGRGGEFVNRQEVDRALGYFTAPCENPEASEGE